MHINIYAIYESEKILVLWHIAPSLLACCIGLVIRQLFSIITQKLSFGQNFVKKNNLRICSRTSYFKDIRFWIIYIHIWYIQTYIYTSLLFLLLFFFLYISIFFLRLSVFWLSSHFLLNKTFYLFSSLYRSEIVRIFCWILYDIGMK